MKYLKYNLIAILTLVLVIGCQEEDQEFGDVTTPTNLVLDFEVVGANADNPDGDGSGIVNFTASADDAITYRYNFGDNTSVNLAPNGESTHRFNQQGINTYNVTVIASGTGGVTTSTSVQVTVFSAFDDIEVRSFLTGAPTMTDEDGNVFIDIDSPTSKTWYWANSTTGHLGVGPSLNFDIQINGGPAQYWFPAFFAASDSQICGDDLNHCLCSDELTFTLETNNQLTYVLNNNGSTFFNGGHQAIVGGDGNGGQCFDFDTSGTSQVSLSPSTEDWSQVGDPDFEPRQTVLNFSDDAFMGYYISNSSYEIIEITDDFMYVRVLDGLNSDLVWYHKFVTTPPGEEEQNILVSEFDTLVWQDDFNTDGAPNPANWTYDIGTGDNGWGNGESQYYTNDADNVIVENGNLKITARAESFMGSDYTSARIKSENLFDFTYGRVDIRAKLPSGGGTWPALWTLGSDYQTNPWPGCGEMDIMEHVGNQQNTIFASLHYPGNFAGDAVTSSTSNPTASTEFHVYTMEWRDDMIIFAIDNQIYHSIVNDGSLPFNSDFFFIMNVAMGGTFGGAIDAGFTESSMEVDYIEVYQN